MSDKILYSDIISPDVQKQLDSLKNTIKELTDELVQLKSATEKEDATTEDFNDTLRDTVEVTDDLLRLTQEEIALKRDLARTQVRLDKALADGSINADEYAIAVKRGKESLSSLGFELRNAAKLTNATKTSMTQLSLELGRNRMAYRKLTTEQRKNKKIGGELLKTILKQDKAIKKLDAQIGNHQRNVGNYTSIVSGLSSTMSGISPNIYKVAAAFRVYVSVMKMSTTAMAGMSKGAKALRVALISTGIGAIVVALGTLIAALTQSNMISEKFSSWWVTLKGLFTGTLDQVGLLGDALFKLFSGDFVGAWDTATDAIKGWKGAVGEAVKEAERLHDQQKIFAQFQKRQAMADVDALIRLTNLRKGWEDEKKGMGERIAIWDQWQKTRLLAAGYGLIVAKQELAAMEKTNEGYDAQLAKIKLLRHEKDLMAAETVADFIKMAEIKKFYGEDEFFYDPKQDIEYQRALAKQEAAKLSIEADKEMIASFMRRNNEEAIVIAEATEREIAYAKLVEQLRIQKLVGNIQMANAIGQSLVAIASAGSKSAEEQKQLAIAGALINTFAGVGIAFGTYGPTPVGFAAAAIALASGIANVVKIQNTQVPSYAVGTDAVPETGMALIHQNERILPSHVNEQLGHIANDQIPGLVSLGIKVPGLQSGISDLVELQRQSNNMISKWAWVDKNGAVHHLSGDIKYYS